MVRVTDIVYAAQLDEWLNSVKADVNESSEIFSGCVRCVAPKDLFDELKNIQGFDFLLLNVFSVFRNQPETIAALLDFLSNFVVRFRKSLISEKNPFKIAAQVAFDYAASDEALSTKVVVSNTSFLEKNFTYSTLNRIYGYVADQDLANVGFPTIVSELQRQVKELAHLNHRLRVRLTRRKAELAAMAKARAAAPSGDGAGPTGDAEPPSGDAEPPNDDEQPPSGDAAPTSDDEKPPGGDAEPPSGDEKPPSGDAEAKKRKSDAKKEKLQALIDENTALREQNEQLQTKHQELIELARAIPGDISRGSLVGINQVLPQRLVDIQRVISAFGLLTEKVNISKNPEIEGLLGELNQLLNSLQQERDTIEANVTSLQKVARDEQAAAESEAGQLRDLATRIISELSGDGEVVPEAATTDAVAEEQPPLEDPVRLLRWDSVTDSPEWTRIRAEQITVNRPQLVQLFGTGEIAEGKLLSPFTARQYEIALKKLKHPVDEIVGAVRQEAFWLAETSLLLLLRLPASAQELRNIANFNGDIAALTEPEQLAVGLQRIPDFRGKIRGMIEFHRFDVAFDVLMQGLAKFNDGLKRLNSATTIRRALAVVLRIGNALNSQSGNPPASGFSINEALEFRFVKTNEKGRRLLHALIPALEENGIQIADVKAEGDSLISASKISLEGILESLRLVLVQLAHRPRVPFVVSASQRVRDAIGKVQQVQLTRDRITRSFGVREVLLKGSGLLSAFIEFANELNRAVKENAARQEKPSGAAAGRTAAPAQQIKVDETKARGLHAAMTGTLKCVEGLRRHAPAVGRNEPEPENEFAKAFAKVRKIVQ